MGTKLKELVVKKEISIEDLKGKTLVVDSFNVLYQFLSSIRQRDGSLLTDSKGNVTSHLVGLFSRTSKLVNQGIRLAFVFDGAVPELKAKEIARRAHLKEEAFKEYKVAKEREDVEEMKKWAARTTKLTKDMIEEAKELIRAMGMPVIQAPSEGEAQAAHIVKNGEAYAEVSQDYDCLVFGVPRLIQNLTISEKRKKPGKLGYDTIKPEMIDLDDTLKNLDIDQDQLIALAMLIGTDFNPGGIKGIGPKNALKLVKKHDGKLDALFKEVEWDKSFDFGWKEVFDLLKHMPVTDKYEMKWHAPDREKIIKLLVDKHDFSMERVEKTIGEIVKKKVEKEQSGLGKWVQ
jgi:flap endonuclease-1